jgi:diguanylate cyclase (GGDEF)-like protein
VTPREHTWSAKQLAEFVATLSDSGSEATTIDVALQNIAEAFDAEVTAYLRGGDVISAIGYPRAMWDSRTLSEATTGTTIDVAGIGRCHTAVVNLEAKGPAGDALVANSLVVARKDQKFSWEETGLLRSMARVLLLTLKSVRLIRQLQDQQQLLKRLSLIQRSISTRVPVQEVFQSIVSGASDLIDASVATLTLVDTVEPVWSSIVASTVPQLTEHLPLRIRSFDSLHGETLRLKEVVHLTKAESAGATGPEIRVGVSCPVHNQGTVVGTLIIGSLDEIEAIVAFGEHASMALTDARTLDAMHEAFHDAVTGLPNRSLFLDHLDRAFLDFKENPEATFGLLLCDLDRFKAVNDRLGHPAGDHLLREIGRRLRAELRDPADIVARLGGDEFAVLVSDLSSPNTLASLAKRVVDIVSSPVLIDGSEAFVGVSIGIATAEHGHRVTDILRNADAAMYEAKSSGRSRFVMYESGMTVRALARLELETDLYQALRRSELYLEYQPIVSLSSNTLLGVEALVRWKHPASGLIPPNDFIHLAEDNGLIIPIGHWVLHSACGQLAAWREDDPNIAATFSMSVNVSGRQLQEPSFGRDVRNVLTETGINPSQLCIEITESVLVGDDPNTANSLAEIKALGVRLAIDDFGTGYSSMAYLTRFDVDEVKVDKSFIDFVTSDSDSGKLARTMIGIGQMLHLDVVAEGLESLEQVARLRAMSCERGQGFIFARPLSADALAALVKLPSHFALGPSLS